MGFCNLIHWFLLLAILFLLICWSVLVPYSVADSTGPVGLSSLIDVRASDLRRNQFLRNMIL